MLTMDMLIDEQNHIIKEHIKHVVLYPRKSRPTSALRTDEDIELDLKNQIQRLTSYCEKEGWSYEIRTEIKSGENLTDRPVIQQIFKEILEGKFDAILVVSYDRLSRGSAKDHEEVILTLREGCSVIVEDSGVIYNPFNEQDLQLLKMKGDFSNYEYKSINSRFTLYKRSGAREGKWVAGSPPFGYVRNRKTKRLEIDAEKGDIYRNKILLPFINGSSSHDIAWELNKQKIASPRGNLWTANSILRLLKSEIHLGIIVYNKTQGSRKKKNSINNVPYRKMPEDKWTKAYDAHPKLKTDVEHETVMRLIKNKTRSNKVPELHALSGMIKCFYCGKSLSIQKKHNNRDESVKKCECGGNRGGLLEIVNESIIETAKVLKNYLELTKENDSIPDDKKYLLKELEKMEKKVEVESLSIERIEVAYDKGVYSLEKMLSKKDKIQNTIFELEANIANLRKRLDSFTSISNKEKLNRIDVFINDIANNKNADSKKIRQIYQNVISEIVWMREVDDEIKVTVNFL